MTLVVYSAPGPTFDPNTAPQQQVFDYDTGVFGPGTYTLEVLIPNNYYQIDFVCDAYIDKLGPGNVFYTQQGRMVSADNGGTSAKLSNGASLAGSVFVDAANTGVHDANEIGVGGVKITLTGTTSTNVAVSLNQYTKSDGTYLFNNLAAGKYTIKETQPTSLTDGTDIVGTLGGTMTNDQFATITVAASANGTKYDFGEKTPSTSAATASLTTDPADTTKAAVIVTGTGGVDVPSRSPMPAANTPSHPMASQSAPTRTLCPASRLIGLSSPAAPGNDSITIDSTVTSAVVCELYGGDGNDTLTGGVNCSNIIVGGNGRDTMVGGGLRDVMIGGNGSRFDQWRRWR